MMLNRLVAVLVCCQIPFLPVAGGKRQENAESK